MDSVDTGFNGSSTNYVKFYKSLYGEKLINKTTYMDHRKLIIIIITIIAYNNNHDNNNNNNNKMTTSRTSNNN